jgi:hypothetical protein
LIRRQRNIAPLDVALNSTHADAQLYYGRVRSKSARIGTVIVGICYAVIGVVFFVAALLAPGNVVDAFHARILGTVVAVPLLVLCVAFGCLFVKLGIGMIRKNFRSFL